MPVPANRTLTPQAVRNFGRHGDTGDSAEIPPLTDIQTVSYGRFLQLEATPDQRTASLQAIRNDAEKSMQTVFGDKAWKTYQPQGWWLNNISPAGQ